MKKLFRFIKFVIIILILAIFVAAGTNKTFIYDHYKNDKMIGDGIPLKRFMYFLEDNNGHVKMITPISVTGLQEIKDDYLKKLMPCYGKYYFDEDNRITITNYEIIEKNHYAYVNISYEETNYCSDDYKLSDIWIYDYNSLSTFVSGDITEKAMISLMGDIYDSKRVENPIITDYKSTIKIVINAHMAKYDYKLIFEDFSADEIKVTKMYDNVKQFAVYNINNCVEYLKNLEKS